MSTNKAATPWYLYMIRCKNGHLYTGISTDLERRFQQHLDSASGVVGAKGAKYLRGKGPLKMVYSTALDNRSQALKMESKIKKLKRSEKEKVIAGENQLPLIS